MPGSTDRCVVRGAQRAAMLPTAVLVFLVILASTSGHSRAIGEEAARSAISGGAREYVDVENEHLRLMIPAESLPPEDICQFLLDSLTHSLLFVSNLFGYRANRPLLHIWDDTQLDPDGPVESGAWKGGWNLVIDMSGEVPSTRKDVEWYALRMTHEYVHFVQGNVASSRSMPSAPIAEGLAELINGLTAHTFAQNRAEARPRVSESLCRTTGRHLSIRTGIRNA